MVGVWEEVQRCIGSSIAIGMPGMIAVVCLVRISLSPTNAWRWIGVLTAAATSVVMLLDIWDVTDADDKVITVLLSVCITVAHAGLVVLIPLKPGQIWVRAATIVAAIVTASCVCIVVVSELQGNSFVGRLAGAAAIAAGCGTLSLAILRKFNRTQTEPDRSETAITHLRFFCPKCDLKQSAAFGSVECRRCHYRLQVNPAEPKPAGEAVPDATP